jgi:transposase
MAIMIGTHPPQKALFSYRINLNQRVRDNHPLRKILEVVDFGFVRAEVASFYGYNGNESVPPETILKMTCPFILTCPSSPWR